jgi:hypothetical protein
VALPERWPTLVASQPRPPPPPEQASALWAMGANGDKWGQMGTNGDKWGQMGTNGDAPVFFSKDVTPQTHRLFPHTATQAYVAWRQSVPHRLKPSSTALNAPGGPCCAGAPLCLVPRLVNAASCARSIFLCDPSSVLYLQHKGRLIFRWQNGLQPLH